MSFAARLRQTYLGHPGRVFVATGQLLAAGHFFLTYFYSWGAVSGPSMLPGWDIWGKGAIVSHRHRRGKNVRVGDVVKFKVPFLKSEEAIKRVAGLPGDYVLVHGPESERDEMIQVGLGVCLGWDRALDIDLSPRMTDAFVVQVPQGHCWVLGDNLYASRDSRIYGPVPMALIDGKVIFQTGSWPWQWRQFERVRNPLEEDNDS